MACVSSIANGFEVWTQTFTVPGQSTDVDEAQLGLVAQLNRFFAVNNSMTLVTLSVFSDAKATPDGGQPQYGVRLLLLSGGTQYNAREFDNPAAFEAYTAANPLMWPVHVFNLVPIGVATSLQKLVGVFANRNALHIRGRRPQVIPALADEVIAFFDDGAFEVDVPQNLAQVIRGVNLGNADWPLGGIAPMVKTPRNNTWAGVAPCAYAGAGPSEVQPLPDCDFLNNCCGDLVPLSGSTGIIRNCKVCQDPDEPSVPFSPAEPLTCDWQRFRWTDYTVFRHLGNLGEFNTSVKRNGNRVGILGYYSGVAGSPRVVRYTDDGATWTDSEGVVPISTASGVSFLIYDDANDWWVIYFSRGPEAWVNTNNLVGSWSSIDLSVLTSVDDGDNYLYYANGKYVLVPRTRSISATPPYKYYVSEDLVNWSLCSIPDDVSFYATRKFFYNAPYWYILSDPVVGPAAGGPTELWRSADAQSWSVQIADITTIFGGVVSDSNPVMGGGGGKIVAVGSAVGTGGFTTFSKDHGVTWSTPERIAATASLQVIVEYVDGYYFVLGQEGNTGFGFSTLSIIWTSPTANNWEECPSNQLYSIGISRCPAGNRWIKPAFLSATFSTPYVVYKDGF